MATTKINFYERYATEHLVIDEDNEGLFCQVCSETHEHTALDRFGKNGSVSRVQAFFRRSFYKLFENSGCLARCLSIDTQSPAALRVKVGVLRGTKCAHENEEIGLRFAAGEIIGNSRLPVVVAPKKQVPSLSQRSDQCFLSGNGAIGHSHQRHCLHCQQRTELGPYGGQKLQGRRSAADRTTLVI